MWQKIINEKDIRELEKIYGHFHDSCIVKLIYNSNVYINDDLSMIMDMDGNDNITLVLMRQYNTPKTIELLFENIEKVNILPRKEFCSGEITSATLKYYEKFFIWASVKLDNVKFIEQEDITYIMSKSLKWRIID